MRPGRLLLPALLALLPLPGCQLLYLPFQVLNTALKGVQWAFQNAGGLIPLAGYLVMEEGAPSLPGPGGADPKELLLRPPRGALALVLVPGGSLGDPGLEAALRNRFPRAGRLLPLRFPQGSAPLPGAPSRRGLPVLAAARRGG